MFGHNFYHGTIRKYVAVFGTLFNDVYISRSEGQIKVPLSYGPRDKVLSRAQNDPDLNRPAIVLPRMAFEMVSLNYAPERKLNTILRRHHYDGVNADKKYFQYAPVPYDLEFELSIIVKNTEDGTKIVEQILPFFTPEWTATVELIPEMDVRLDIPIILKDVRVDDPYEGSFEESRLITWTLRFTLKGYIFGPVKSSKVIKFANVALHTSLTSTTPAVNIDVRPGLTANGEPTSSANNTLPLADIYSDDTFGYIVTITDK